MKRPTLLRLSMLAFFLSQGACASISTLEARVVEGASFAVETVILDQGYAEAKEAERVAQEDTLEEDGSGLLSMIHTRIEPVSVALVVRGGKPGEIPMQTELAISSAGTLIFGVKSQLVDVGPFAASVGFKMGTDFISFLDILTDGPDEGDDDPDDVWKKRVQFAMPVIASLHPFEGLDLYAAARVQWLGTAQGYHKLVVGTAGTCVGTDYSVCVEAGKYASIGTDFDGYYGGFSLKLSGFPR